MFLLVKLSAAELYCIHCNSLRSWLLSSRGLSVPSLICDEISYSISLCAINKASGSLKECVLGLFLGQKV